MSKLRPVKKDYDPGYPLQLSEEEIARLLRPGLWQRFAGKTLAAGALLTGLTVAGSALVQADAPPLPSAGKSTRSDAQLQKKVQQIAQEVLGDKEGSWSKRTTQGWTEVLKGNPPLRYPRIQIRFGNSLIGIFDTDKAKEATHRLFAAYGIELQKNVSIKGEGYEFVADGYNDKLGVGFKIIMPEGQVGFRGQPFPKLPAEVKLDAKEMPALERDLKDGKRRLLVVPGNYYPNMDGDQYTPTHYYLGAVIDYLNWVHGDRVLDRDRILGKKVENEMRKDVQ